jgi:HTH-type transcriptional regulator/antitoxin HigA
MESRGITRRDLEPLMGNRARVSEIFNHKRGLTLAMIRKLHDKLGIPVEALIQPSIVRYA